MVACIAPIYPPPACGVQPCSRTAQQRRLGLYWQDDEASTRTSPICKWFPHLARWMIDAHLMASVSLATNPPRTLTISRDGCTGFVPLTSISPATCLQVCRSCAVLLRQSRLTSRNLKTVLTSVTWLILSLALPRAHDRHALSYVPVTHILSSIGTLYLPCPSSI